MSTKKEFDWFIVLDLLIEGKEKEAIDYVCNYKLICDYELRDYLWGKSSEWVTCACGQLCDRLPKYESGAPKDIELWGLGLDFNYYIRDKCYPSAKQTLTKIEKRTIELLNY